MGSEVRMSATQGKSLLTAVALCALFGGCEPTAVRSPASHHATTPDLALSSADSTEIGTVSESEADGGKVIRSEEQWRSVLTREQYHVLREKGTERPFVNKYDHHFEPGTYFCAACDQELFRSETKFNSGCGWPAFYAAAAGDRVTLLPDHSHGMIRTEVICSRCDSHLGHIFDDAPQTPTGQRYCINSVAIVFRPAGKAGEQTARSEEQAER